MAIRDHATFILNGEVVTFRGRPTTTLLDWLRLERRLTGTKEGCAEGDCGACTVAVAELAGDRVRTRSINACILFVPMLEGRSVTTVEGVKGPEGELHPCQQAMVDCHGSQCGFCTPGFVMSLFTLYSQGDRLDRRGIDDQLAGNLCRCTGYGPIIEAAERMWDLQVPAWQDERNAREHGLLRKIAHGGTVDLNHGKCRFRSPTDLAALDDHMNAPVTIVAGATDAGLWVTKQHRVLDDIVHLDRVAELKSIEQRDGKLRIGAAVTYSEAFETIARSFPDLGELLRRLGSTQVRNAGTIGGNVANGSPIGDMPPALIALGATLVLRRRGKRRQLPLEDFFIDYQKQDLRPGEIVEAIEILLLDEPEQLRCYKVSKRFDQDISAVCGCFNVRIEAGIVRGARIAYGGMAAIPKRAKAVEAALLGQPWSLPTVEAALSAYECDFQPIGDMRASASYRLKVAQNLLLRLYHETHSPLAETRLAGRGAVVG